ncbi:energy-coupling factor transporter transmembrane protein EcfT [Candidatus Woesearchaeota archaeon]|nr:energy-coupling factor transporter transmembrane protein EcfT [Candidatus Woesearchaeota archaeon]
MFRKLAFGQYSYKNSIIHRLDPRIKIISVIILSAAAFLIDSYNKITVFSALIILFILISKLKFQELLRNIRPFFFIFIFILAMYAIFSRDELSVGILSIWKFILFISIGSMLTFTTTITGLITAIERLLKPLKITGINIRNFSLLIAMTIRFIPALFLYAGRIKDAQSARLGSMRKPKQVKIFIIRLLERIFNSASTVSDALISRNYNGKRASYFNPIKMVLKDYLSLSILIIVVILII